MSKLQGKEAQLILVNLGLEKAKEIQSALKLQELVKEFIANEAGSMAHVLQSLVEESEK